MRIKVTEEDIKNGLGRSAGRCPVALAVARATRSVYISVGACSICADSLFWDTPAEVAEKVNMFDTTGKMEPFEFELRIGTVL